MVTKETRKKIKHVNNQYFGGYVTYWKLVREFNRQLKVTRSMGGKVPNGFILFFMRIWWRFIKPLGCLFHYVERKQGSIEISRSDSGMILRSYSDVKVKRVWFVFRVIPIWVVGPRRLTNEEFEKLIKEC